MKRILLRLSLLSSLLLVPACLGDSGTSDSPGSHRDTVAGANGDAGDAGSEDAAGTDAGDAGSEDAADTDAAGEDVVARDLREDSTAPGDAAPESDGGLSPTPDATARYIRIFTTESPSWVSWKEVQVVGADLDSDVVSNLALGRPATASDSTSTGPPEHGVDGDEETGWNANDFPPAWFEVDLGRPARIERIRLLVGQDPPGRTVHEIQLRTGAGAYETVHTFDQVTEAGQWLEFVMIDGPDVTPHDDWDYTCERVGVGHGDGFFRLAEFRGQLYAGLFGYGLEDRSMLYRYPDWELVEPGLTGIGESVCALREFDGALYANTENSGDIYRSFDGTHWERVHNGEAGSIGCGLAEFGGDLYAVNYRYSHADHGKVLRQVGDDWRTVYDSGDVPLYLREIVTYDGVLYAFAIHQDTNQGQMLTSTNGSDWTLTEVGNRYFRGYVWRGFLWLGATDRGGADDASVFRFDGSEFVQTHRSSRRYVADLHALDDRLFISTSNGFKDDVGPSGVWVSGDGESDWEQVCEFSETAAWSMAVVDDELYVGTWEFRRGGSVYHVRRVDPDPGSDSDPPDCERRSGTLDVGATYTVEIDAHTGDEDTTEPKTDANDGRGGDRIDYRRHNVARAHNRLYWYTSNHRVAGEPDPSGEQHVDYVPDFSSIGVGCYHIVAQYQSTENRALYAAEYLIRDGERVRARYEVVQERGPYASVGVDLGTHVMCPESYLRIRDPGPNSITFNAARFTYRGPTCD